MKNLTLEEYAGLFDPAELDNINSFVKLGSRPCDYECVAMDMGGTNFRIARVSFDVHGTASITGLDRFIMPGVKNEISADEFFEFFEEEKKRYGAGEVALCFSYPAEILEDLSARIITFSKGVKITGAEGRIIHEKVVNDTTAALLGTKGANMGMILGTGFNICYVKNGIILNAEAGRYKGFPMDDIDFGELSEMQISGAYINKLISLYPEKRAELIDRASKLVAVEIAGIAEYAGIRNAKIVAEGSVFYRFDELRNGICHYLDILAVENGFTYEFLDGRDKTLIGAAVAAYMNSECVKAIR